MEDPVFMDGFVITMLIIIMSLSVEHIMAWKAISQRHN